MRAARDRAAQAEQRVSQLDGEVGALTRTLDDPELYTRPGGVERAHKLGAQLDTLRARLDEALAAWEQETAALESLERAPTT
jgi:exonuclease VII small subunit